MLPQLQPTNIAVRVAHSLCHNPCSSSCSASHTLQHTALYLSRHRRRVSRCAASSRRSGSASGGGGGADLINYYELLDVPRGADEDAVRTAYRRLQQRFHPDKPGEGSEEQSRLLNQAVSTLTDPGQRREYDRELRLRLPKSAATLRSPEGLVSVGPASQVLATELLPEGADAACEFDLYSEECAGGRDEMVYWLRQWAQTLTFCGELPLPLPLQADGIPGGARLGFITVSDGIIRMLGELRFTVEPADAVEPVGAAALGGEGQQWAVAVRRVGAVGELPGEGRILRSFQDACRHHRGEMPKGISVGGILAAIATSAIGSLPLGGFGLGPTANYEAYYLKKQQTSAGQQKKREGD